MNLFCGWVNTPLSVMTTLAVLTAMTSQRVGAFAPLHYCRTSTTSKAKATSGAIRNSMTTTTTTLQVSTLISTTSAASAYSTTAVPITTSLTQELQRHEQQQSVDLRHVDFSRDYDPKVPPVLLLHGLLGNKRNFATIGNSLSNQLTVKRRLVGLDLRNHGDNQHDWRDDMTYESMAYDVKSWLDRHQIDQAVLVGHSMGGKVAQALALLCPQRVKGLVVLDIAPVKYCASKDAHWKAVQEIVSVLNAVDVGPGVTKQQVDQQLRAAIPDPALRAFCLTNYDARQGRWKIPLKAIASQLEQLADFEICSSKRYGGDAFFIHGGQSRFIRHSYIQHIANFFPNHLLTTIRGAGHWIHAEAPDDTTALLKKFLDR